MSAHVLIFVLAFRVWRWRIIFWIFNETCATYQTKVIYFFYKNSQHMRILIGQFLCVSPIIPNNLFGCIFIVFSLFFSLWLWCVLPEDLSTRNYSTILVFQFTTAIVNFILYNFKERMFIRNFIYWKLFSIHDGIEMSF